MSEWSINLKINAVCDINQSCKKKEIMDPNDIEKICENMQITTVEFSQFFNRKFENLFVGVWVPSINLKFERLPVDFSGNEYIILWGNTTPCVTICNTDLKEKFDKTIRNQLPNINIIKYMHFTNL